MARDAWERRDDPSDADDDWDIGDWPAEDAVGWDEDEDEDEGSTVDGESDPLDDEGDEDNG
jgi:hypothetical protein